MNRTRLVLIMVALLVAIVVLRRRTGTRPTSDEPTESGTESILTPRTANSDPSNKEPQLIMDDPKTYTTTRAGWKPQPRGDGFQPSRYFP